jgi:four helix bundle protein
MQNPSELHVFREAEEVAVSLGSATELQFQLRLSHRFGYVGADDHRTVSEMVRRVENMLIRLILRVRPASEASRRRP